MFSSSCKHLKGSFLSDYTCAVTKLKVKDGERKVKCETDRHKECEAYKKGGGGWF